MSEYPVGRTWLERCSYGCESSPNLSLAKLLNKLPVLGLCIVDSHKDGTRWGDFFDVSVLVKSVNDSKLGKDVVVPKCNTGNKISE